MFSERKKIKITNASSIEYEYWNMGHGPDRLFCSHHTHIMTRQVMIEVFSFFPPFRHRSPQSTEHFFVFITRPMDGEEEEEVEEKLRVISLSLGSRGEAMCTTPSER